MKEILYERIAILEQNGVISPKAAAYSRHVTDLILAADEAPCVDNGDRRIMQNAMADERS